MRILVLHGPDPDAPGNRQPVICGRATVEVHLSNPNAREVFRHTSLSSGAAVGVVQGFGPAGYGLALRGLVGVLSREDE